MNNVRRAQLPKIAELVSLALDQALEIANEEIASNGRKLHRACFAKLSASIDLLDRAQKNLREAQSDRRTYRGSTQR